MKISGPQLLADLIDRQFGRLTAKYYVGRAADGSGAVWRCQCECGAWIKVRRKQLIAGDTKSCGCLRRDHDKWQGNEGIDKIIDTLKDGMTEVTSDDLGPALRLTRVLVTKFGAATIAKALREIRKEGR